MAKYRALARHFIAPYTIQQGAVFTVDDNWPPSLHVEPLDAAAEAAVAELGRRDTRDPIEQRPNIGDSVFVESPAEEAAPDLDLRSPGGPPKAEPGLTAGGKAKPPA